MVCEWKSTIIRIFDQIHRLGCIIFFSSNFFFHSLCNHLVFVFFIQDAFQSHFIEWISGWFRYIESVTIVWNLISKKCWPFLKKGHVILFFWGGTLHSLDITATTMTALTMRQKKNNKCTFVASKLTLWVTGRCNKATKYDICAPDLTLFALRIKLV